MMMTSFFSIKAFLKVSSGLIPRKNPILAFVYESYFLILRKAELVRSVSKIPLYLLDYDPYFSWDIVWVDSNLKETYPLLVTLHIRQSLNTFLYFSSVGTSLP